MKTEKKGEKIDILIKQMWCEGDISSCKDEIDRTYSRLKNIFINTTHMWDDFIKTPDYSESLNQKDDEELLSRLLQIIDLEKEHGSMVESSITKEHGSMKEEQGSDVGFSANSCKDCEFTVSGQLKRSKINQKLQAHRNKNHPVEDIPIFATDIPENIRQQK